METVTQVEEKSQEVKQEVKTRFKVGDKVYIQKENDPGVLETGLVVSVDVKEILEWTFRSNLFKFILNPPEKIETFTSVKYEVALLDSESSFYFKDFFEKYCYDSTGDFFQKIKLDDFIEHLQKQKEDLEKEKAEYYKQEGESI